ncbi:g-type lectin s-receptor-like serine/threonine-protein kinase at5g24080 [Phtheirospermum japonicum]|uniref:G-type lectin s-receptor-like serine/threonine-protein kinase at5g24080 n=1 Tax=Phtheirospermum japonicum TaxID=374723 RepID=A0A830B8K9_9LAMI|nr:g-type lectin s-receptor-like serine/threonine-protein kinase at5g24080 [Phtheirospermum japonicum]
MINILSLFSTLVFLLSGSIVVGRIDPGARLSAGEDRAWVSGNGTFAFGFAPINSRNDRFQLGIWFAQLPGDRTLVWSADINSPVTKDATLDFQTDGDLVLRDRRATVWTSNTSGLNVQTAVMSENGNLVLYGPGPQPAWQSFAHPSDTLLPGQPLTVSLELKSPNSPAHNGYYTLKMLQQPNSLSLALSYNLPESNFSYWSGPDISNVTGNVVAVLDDGGSFGILYGSSSDGAVYVYKNDNDSGALSSALNRTSAPLVPRRLILETNGNLRLYRWDDDVNGSRQWVPEWAAVSKPCDIAGICGDGICNMDRSRTNAACAGLPGGLISPLAGKCGPHRENLTSRLNISAVQQTNYYFSDSSVIANYSDIETVSRCGDACLSDCKCVASVYGLNEEKAYCWVLRELEFGGYEDPGSTLFVKVESNGGKKSDGGSSDGLSSREGKVIVLPIVLSMTVLIGLLFCLLYINVRRKRNLKNALENSLIVSGAPVNFSYRDLQLKTSNFSELLGTGGFGSVYKGSLSDGTLIAVKKLDRVLPHGEKEFITEATSLRVHEEWVVGQVDIPFEMTSGTPNKVADRRLEGAVEEEELVRALKAAFWCIQDEIGTRPTMGEVVKMLEGSVEMNVPPMPQTVLELVEEGLDHVYKAMKREFNFNQFSSFTTISHLPSSLATCSYSTMSPR